LYEKKSTDGNGQVKATGTATKQHGNAESMATAAAMMASVRLQ